MLSVGLEAFTKEIDMQNIEVDMTATRTAYLKDAIAPRFFYEPVRTREKLRRLILRRKGGSHLIRWRSLGTLLLLRMRLAMISLWPSKETLERSTLRSR